MGKSNIDTSIKYQPQTTNELIELVEDETIKLYQIDISNLTSLRAVFNYSNRRSFKGLEDWNTSNIVDISYLFHGSNIGNLNLNKWDVSKVKYMVGTFKDCEFNGKINKWNVSNAIDMSFLFSHNKKFNGDLSGWNVSNLINLGFTFEHSAFNGDLSRWDVSKVKNFHKCFYNSKFNKNISSWDISQALDLSYMFAYSQFNQDLSCWNKWDKSEVINFYNMFAGTSLDSDNFRKENNSITN